MFSHAVNNMWLVMWCFHVHRIRWILPDVVVVFWSRHSYFTGCLPELWKHGVYRAVQKKLHKV